MAIKYENSLDRTFHALGDGTRRKILSILAQGGQRSASELREPFDSAQPTVSKHLKVLESAGLVHREVRGRAHLFSINLQGFLEAEEWLTRHKSLWEGAMDQLADFLGETKSSEETP